MATKAEEDDELHRKGDERALIKAALASCAIILNGIRFKPEEPTRPEDFSKVLNASLRRPGQKARFEFDDHSYLEVTAAFERGKGSRSVWVECGHF